MLRETKDFVSYFAEFTLVWVAGRPIVCDTIVVCFSFTFIEFSLKRFLSFFNLIALCLLASSRFGTLAEFCTVAECSFGSLADC